MKYIFVLVWLLLAGMHGLCRQSQQEKTAKALADIQAATSDTARTRAILAAAYQYILRPDHYPQDMDSALLLIGQAKSIAADVPEKAWHLKCLYYEGLVLLERGKFDSARLLILPLAADFGRLKEVKWQAKALEAYAGYLPIGSWAFPADTAVKYYLQSAALYAQVKGEEMRVIHLRRAVADLHLGQGKFDLAEQELLRLEQECIKLDKSYIVHIQALLSRVHMNRGNYHIAASYGMKTIASMEKYGVRDNYANACMDVANVFYKVDNYVSGLEWHRKSFEVYKKTSPNFVYIFFSKLIVVMIKVGQTRDALQLVQQTARDFPPQYDWEKDSYALSMGNCYNALKEYDKAEKFYRQVASYEPDGLSVNTLNNLVIAQFYIDRKKYDLCRHYAEFILRMPAENVTPEDRSATHYILYQADSAQGRFLAAMQHLSRHKMLSDSLFNDRKEKQAQELNIQYETYRKEKDLQLKNQSIHILQKTATLQTLQLEKAKSNRNLALSVAGLLLVIMGLLWRQYRVNKRNTMAIGQKNDQLQELIGDKDRLLHEKEWLLKEVHHRVKNNLQTVLSLLESQSRHVSREALPALRTSQDRVYAMSLIHKKLYQSDEVTSIDMNDYLCELLQHMRDSLVNEKDILFRWDLDPVELDVSQAVPVGLIVNEAVTNAVKYAFLHTGGKGEVMVSLKREPDSSAVHLTIADNGSGMPTTMVEGGGLGMKLMRGLADDIDGKLTIQAMQGTSISIVFEANMPLHKASEVLAAQSRQ